MDQQRRDLAFDIAGFAAIVAMIWLPMLLLHWLQS